MRINLNNQWDLEIKDNCINAELPNTTARLKLGELNKNKETLYLTEEYLFEGIVYLKNTINIPKKLDGEKFLLFLERTKMTEVFIDGELVSSSNAIARPQKHILYLSSGMHEMKIKIDNNFNNEQYLPKDVLNGHQLSEHTQKNWNGIIGDIYLEHIPFYIEKVITYGDFYKKKLELRFLSEDLKENFTNIEVNAVIRGKEYKVELELEKNVLGFIELDDIQLYDEFNPQYEKILLKIKLGDNELKIEEIFYFRNIEVRDRFLYVNDSRISIRGNLDCASFPILGHCPTDRESWEKICKIHMDYGFNLIRFHSWCPPEIAFCVADELGIYLQVELSIFGAAYYKKENPMYKKLVNDYVNTESFKLLDEYGNHPSFLIFAIGNEMCGDLDEFNQIVLKLKEYKKNIFHTMGSNNFCAGPVENKSDDVWIATKTDQRNIIRSSNAFSDFEPGYIYKNITPCTNIDFENEANLTKLPLIAHETGQYQAFPNFDEISKYSGVLKPRNFEIFKDRLKSKGMLDRWKDYFYASTRVQMECYKEDIEANLRSNSLSGFQLLSLQDFSGQGTALVGILDAFYEEKGIIKREDWKQFCNNKVLLGRFNKYTYFSGEEFNISVEFYNYSNKDIKDNLKISLVYSDVLSKSKMIECKKSSKMKVADFSFNLPKSEDTLEIDVILECGDVKNKYTIWVYKGLCEDPQNTKVVFNLDDVGKNINDRNVLLLLPNANSKYSVTGAYATDFWCFSMFGVSSINRGAQIPPGTLGGLIKNTHKAFDKFKTNKYASKNFARILNNSRPIILDDLIEGLEPIVTMIDNFDRNQNIGQLFEVEYSGNRLMVCTCNLVLEPTYPEFIQLYNSLLNYLNQEEYNCKKINDKEFHNIMSKLKYIDPIIG